MATKKKLQVYITENQELELKAERIRVGLTVSALVSMLIQKYIVDKKGRQRSKK